MVVLRNASGQILSQALYLCVHFELSLTGTSAFSWISWILGNRISVEGGTFTAAYAVEAAVHCLGICSYTISPAGCLCHPGRQDLNSVEASRAHAPTPWAAQSCTEDPDGCGPQHHLPSRDL